MRKLIPCALVGLAITASSFAPKASESEIEVSRAEGHVTLLRTKGFERLGTDTYKIWLRRSYKEPRRLRGDPDKAKYSEMLQQRVLDCRQRTMKTVATHYLDANGRVLRRTEKDDDEASARDFRPGSVGAAVVERSCSFLRGR